MKYYIHIIILQLWLLLLAGAAIAQKTGQRVDTVGPGHLRLSTSYLHPGLHQYIIYIQDSSRKRTLFYWYWLRRIDREERDGRSFVRISQHWFGQDTGSYRESVSVNRAEDFLPVSYTALRGVKDYTYQWSDTGNVFNWDLDMETFEMLPLAEGKVFAINFYDAGLEPPKYVCYRVTGSEVLSMLDGARVECWKLSTEGEHGAMHYTETFWISKKKHIFLKEEDHFGSGFRLKMLMPENTPDPMRNFEK